MPRRRGRTWLAGAGLQRLAWFGIPAMSPRYFASATIRFAASLRRGWLAESARRRSPYFGARSLPLRFLAVNAIRIRWEILRACIF
jgi:hypothetical protein